MSEIDPLTGLLEDHYGSAAPEVLPETGASILRRARRRRLPVAAAALLALAGIGAGLAMQGPGESALTPRGVGDVDVRLEFVVEGDALRRGGDVRLDEAVNFRVTTAQPGFLCLTELADDGIAVFPPPGGEWEVTAGSSFPALDGRVQAWRTDAGEGERTYRVLLDLEYPDCRSPAGQAEVQLRWVP